MSTRRKQLEAWARANPEFYAGLQRAISGAEGTILGGQPGYNVMFGGGRFKDFSRHPDKVITSPGGYSSAAAGAYQFLPGTYKGSQQRLGLKDFSPESQNLAMLDLVQARLAPIGGLAAITKAGTLTPQIQAALAPEWASFPTMSGKSYYGQPVKKQSDIQKFFEEGKKTAIPAAVSPQTPTTTPTERGNNLGQSLLQSVMGLIPGLRRRSSIDTFSSSPSYDPNKYLNNFLAMLNQEDLYS